MDEKPYFTRPAYHPRTTKRREALIGWAQMTPEQRKVAMAAATRAYYQENREKIQAAHRDAATRGPQPRPPSNAARHEEREAWYRARGNSSRTHADAVLPEGFDDLPPEQQLLVKRRASQRAAYHANLEASRADSRWRSRLSRMKGVTAAEPTHCEICGVPPAEGKPLHADHNHTTGAFRGWLCRGCNHALGNVKDNPSTLRKLADYLDGASTPM